MPNTEYNAERIAEQVGMPNAEHIGVPRRRSYVIHAHTNQSFSRQYSALL
jgi:hypothetical protein